MNIFLEILMIIGIVIASLIALLFIFMLVFWLIKRSSFGKNTYNPDLNGKIILVTGGNSGIGKETARKFFELGAKVIITGRSEKKCREFLKELQMRPGFSNPAFYQVDFSDLNRVKEFADKIKNDFERLDILVNNAGCFMGTYNTSRQGVELTMAVNHLSPVYLTWLLTPLLNNSPEPRVINVSSTAHLHFRSKFKNFIDDDFWLNKPEVDYEKEYHFTTAYGMSKMGNVLFSRGLRDWVLKTASEDEEEKKTSQDSAGGIGKLFTASLHPGDVKTNIARDAENMFIFKLMKPILACAYCLIFKNEVQGAQTSLYLSLAPLAKLQSGEYNDDCKLVKDIGEEFVQKYTPVCWNETVRLLRKLTGEEVFPTKGKVYEEFDSTATPLDTLLADES